MKNIFYCIFILIAGSTAVLSCYKDPQKSPSSKMASDASTEVRAQSFCEDAEGNCTGPYNLRTLTNIYGIQPYPNCPFSITYKFRDCPAGADMIFVGMSYQINNPGCSQFDLDTNDPVNGPAVLDEVIRKLINHAIIVEGFDIAEPCPNNFKSINFFQSTCAKRCLVQEYDGEGELYYKIINVPCGSGCCKTSIGICIDANGKVQTSILSAPTGTGDCPPQLSPPCPFGTIREGQCRPSCLRVGTGG